MLITRKAGLGLSVISTASVLLVTGCGSSAPTSSATTSSLSNLSSAMSTLQSSISSSAPRLKQDTTTAFNDSSFRWNDGFLKGWLNDLFPVAKATTTSALGDIWDPASLYTTDGNVIITNLYDGGGSTCSYTSLTGTCTNGENTYESVKNWMGQAMNNRFTNSSGASTTVFGRLAHASMVGCVIGNVDKDLDSDGLPKAGSLSLTMPSDTSNKVFQSPDQGGCGLETAMAGATISGSVTALTGGGLFSKKMSITVGGHADISYLKLDSAHGVFHFMEVEDERPDHYQAARTLATIDGGKTMFEYISLGSPITTDPSGAKCTDGSGNITCGYEFYRIYMDTSTDVAYLISNYGSMDNSEYVRFTAAGKPNEINACSGGSSCSTSIALSLSLKSQLQVSSGSAASYNTPNDVVGCVDPGTGDITTDDSLNCGLTGTTVSDATAIDNERTLYYSDVMASLLANSGESTTLAFTGPSDFFTAVPSQ